MTLLNPLLISSFLRLKSFDGVAVREYQGCKLLQTMGIDGIWVLDPVFLLSVDEWNNFVNRESYDYAELLKEPYLLIYDFEGNDFVEIVCIGENKFIYLIK